MSSGASTAAAEFILLAAVSFGPLAFGCVEPWSLAILEILILTLGALSFLGPLPARSGELLKNFLPAVLAVIALGFFQRLNAGSILEPRSLLPFTAAAHETSRALLLWCAYACLLWRAPAVFSKEGSRRRFVWVMLCLGLIVAVIGIVQLHQGNKLVYGFRPVRYGRSPFGPYFNRSHAASMLALSWLLGAGLFLSAFFRFKREAARGARLPHFILRQTLTGLALGVIFYGIILTRNRGSVIAVSLSLWLIAFLGADFFKTRRQAGAWRAALLLGTMGLAAIIFVSPDFSTYLRGSSINSFSQRLSLYQGALAIIKDFPLFGIGLGGLIGAYPPYRDPLIIDVVDHIHSDWLEFVLQLGLAGSAIYFLGLFAFLRKTLKFWKSAYSREQRCLIGGGLAAALAFVFQGLVEFSFQIPANAVLFFTVLAWLGAREESREEVPAAPGPLRIAAACACLLLLAAAVPWSKGPRHFYEQGKSSFHLAQADPENGATHLRQALIHADNALKAEPLNQDSRRLMGAVLQRLGRSEDAADFSR